MTEQSESNAATCLADDPASSDSAEVAMRSSAGSQGSRRGAQLSKKGKGREGGGSDGSDEEGVEGKEKRRRRARISLWAKRTVNAMQSASHKGHDHSARINERANPTRSAD